MDKNLLTKKIIYTDKCFNTFYHQSNSIEDFFIKLETGINKVLTFIFKKDYKKIIK